MEAGFPRGNHQARVNGHKHLMAKALLFLTVIFVLCMSDNSSLELMLHCYFNMPTINKTYLISW